MQQISWELRRTDAGRRMSVVHDLSGESKWFGYNFSIVIVANRANSARL